MNKKLLKMEVIYMDRRVTEDSGGVSGLKKRKIRPFGIAFMPVSYTHLDVYKRQGIFRAWCGCYCNRK